MTNNELKFLIDSQEIAIQDIASWMGVHISTVYRWLGVDGSPPKRLINVLRERGVDVSSLTLKSPISLQVTGDQKTKVRGGVPFYDLNITTVDMDIFAQIPGLEPTTWINLPGFADCDAAFPVFGDYSNPPYNHGAIIGVKEVTDRSVLLFGAYYLAVTKDLRLVCRLEPSKIEGHVRMVPDNSQYTAIELHLDKITYLYFVKGAVNLHLNML